MSTSAYPLLSAYFLTTYRYKRMRLITRVYGTPSSTYQEEKATNCWLMEQSHVRRGQKAQYCIPGSFCMAQNVMVNANRLATVKIRTMKISIFC